MFFADWIISFAPLKQDSRVACLSHAGLVETAESSQAIQKLSQS